MFESPRVRAVGIALLLVVLFGLFVWMGTTEPYPDYPDTEDLAEDYEAHVGEYAEADGTVVATDPVVIEDDHPSNGTVEFVVRDVDESVEPGQEFEVFGVVEPDHTIRAEETVVRDQWEFTYMYAVSILAAVWVFTRFVRQWRFDRDAYGFVPRGDRDG
jgi:hypothetical protein